MFKNNQFLVVKHYAAGASGSGNSSADPASPVDSDVVAILSDAVIEKCDVIIKTAVTGSIDIGDDDDADGFAATAGITEGTPGVYVGAGAYLTGGAKKRYASEGKEVKLDATTITAGSFAVVVQGYRI
ncbi:MAG: hypothetical protein EBX40_03120 [Gammaproteobacteria bacterium]|nr:hypothetical protein [Gammaproteobacteria bacterium]